MKVIAPGIYEGPDGRFRALARVGDRKTGPAPREKRFPAGTALRTMRQWQEDQRADLRRADLRPVKGTLAADVVRYLDLPEVKALTAFKDRVREISSWLPDFGHLQRHILTTDLIRARLSRWRYEDDYSAQWCNLRRHALGHLYARLDGKSARNPVRDVPKFKGPKAEPKWLAYDVIEAVFAEMRDRKSLPRLMLIAYAGYRPSEIKRTMPEDILPFLGLPEPFAIKRCGKGGNTVPIPLIEQAASAWQRLIAGLKILDVAPELWIKKMRFGSSSLNKNWKEAMVRAGEKAITAATAAGVSAEALCAIAMQFKPVNCYRLKHSFAVRLLLACDSKDLVQKALGHTSAKTTSIYTQMAVDPRLSGAMRKAFAS